VEGRRIRLKKTESGSIAVIFGGLLLALQIYGLKIIYLMEMSSGSPWRESPLAYLKEPNVKIAILITSIIIIYGVVLIIKDKISNTSKSI
jgi:hypothetical protein